MSKRPLDLLHDAFHRPGTRVFQVMESFIWFVILASVALFAYEAVAYDIDKPPLFLTRIDLVFMGIFVVELLARVGSYRPPRSRVLRPDVPGWWAAQVVGRVQFLFTPLMLIDLLTILAVVPALRALRAVRLLRLLRTSKIFRFSNPYLGFMRSFQENALLYLAAFGFLLANVLVGGISLYLAEVNHNPSIMGLGDGLWWALVTITTVGYGDITPMTSAGRAVAGGIMVGGMFTLALFASLVGTTLMNTMLSMKEDQFRMSTFANHIVVCGYDNGTRLLLDSLTTQLPSDENQVLIFGEGERPMDLPADFTWVPGDPTKESEHEKVQVRWARAVIVVGSRKMSPSEADARTILTIFTVRSRLAKYEGTIARKAPVYIVAEVLDTENVAHATTAGADEVIETDRIGYDLLAHAVVAHGSASILSRVAAAGNLSVYSSICPHDRVLTYAETFARLHSDFQVTLLGIRRLAKGPIIMDLGDEAVVYPDDELVYLGKKSILVEVS